VLFRSKIIKSASLTPFADCTGEVVKNFANENSTNSKQVSKFAINANDNDAIKINTITDKYKLCLTLKWQNDILRPKFTTRKKPKWYTTQDSYLN